MNNKLCEYCNKEHQGKYGSGRFCSQSCARASAGLNSKNKTKRVQCVKCGHSFEVKLRSSQNVCYQCKQKQNTKTLYCNNCGIAFQYIIHRKNQIPRFCSKSCASSVSLKKWYKFANEEQKFHRSQNIIKNRSIQLGGKTQWYQIQTSNGIVKVQGTYQKRTVLILQKWKTIKKIKDWEYNNSLRIEYKWQDGSIHYYLPDFKIYTNQNKLQLIEVKGYKKVEDQWKWNETINQGYTLFIWFQKDIIMHQKQIADVI